MYHFGMRFTFVLGLSLVASAQNACSPQAKDPQDLQNFYCPKTHELEVAPSQKFFLDGNIGKRHVRMYLDRGGSGVVGLFFDREGKWEVTQFGGTWNDGRIEASNATEGHPATSHLKAILVDGRLRERGPRKKAQILSR